MNPVELSKEILKEELDNPNYARSPFAHGVTERYICDYIASCVDNGVSQSECKEWVVCLCKEKEVPNQYIDCIILGIIAVYRYAETHNF